MAAGQLMFSPRESAKAEGLPGDHVVVMVFGVIAVPRSSLLAIEGRRTAVVTDHGLTLMLDASSEIPEEWTAGYRVDQMLTMPIWRVG